LTEIKWRRSFFQIPFYFTATLSKDLHVDDNDFTGRKNAMYGQWMSSSWSVEEKIYIQHYHIRDLPHRVIRNMARFRTSSHYLYVETDKVEAP
jgi:hypothetical protein